MIAHYYKAVLIGVYYDSLMKDDIMESIGGQSYIYSISDARNVSMAL
ncbi:MAG: hypothetical protein HOC71_01250 [Candidatus Latescibacteria bacterium]|nr:hypothetical protein [Candidatus Latescibacterota bacterium]